MWQVLLGGLSITGPGQVLFSIRLSTKLVFFLRTENLPSRWSLTTAQTLSQMESLRVGTDGLVSLPEVGDSSSFDLSNGRARIMHVHVPL